MEIRYSVQYNLNGGLESRFYKTTVPIQMNEILSVDNIGGHKGDLKVTKITRNLHCNNSEMFTQSSDDLWLDIECEVVNVRKDTN